MPKCTGFKNFFYDHSKCRNETDGTDTLCKWCRELATHSATPPESEGGE